MKKAENNKAGQAAHSEKNEERPEGAEDMTPDRDIQPPPEPAAEGAGGLEELPQEMITRVKSELEAKIKEAEDNFNKFLRTAADLDNYKKRVEKEKAEIMSLACENAITGILPVLDNLERAFSHAQGGHDNLEALSEGVKLTIEQFRAVLQKLGLTEVKAVGDKFDPSLHHAISHEDAAGAAPGTVVKEFQKGYFLKGRLMRPSMVGVAKGPEDEAR